MAAVVVGFRATLRWTDSRCLMRFPLYGNFNVDPLNALHGPYITEVSMSFPLSIPFDSPAWYSKP